jgi:hypothetical protein
MKFLPCFYEPIVGHDTRYNYLFNEEYIINLNKYYSFGINSDAVYAYKDKKDGYRIIVNDISAFQQVELNEITLSGNCNLDDIEFYPGDKGEFEDNPKLIIESNICHDESNILIIKVSNSSEMRKVSEGKDYISFCGGITSVGIANEKGEYQFTFRYDEFKPISSYLIFIKKRERFFMIIVNSSKNEILDDKVMQLFDLI